MTVVRTRLAAILLAAPLGLPGQVLAAPADAGDSTRAGVLPLQIQVEGQDPERLQTLFSDGLERAGARWNAIDRSACDDACVREVAGADGLTHVVRARLVGASRDYELTAEILDADGTVVATTGGTCDTCGASELEDFLAEHAVRVAEKLQSFQTRPPVLIIESDPPGATVWVDGEAVGKTPLQHTTVAGDREIKLELRGHVSAERSVEMVAGVDETVRLTLQPQPKPETDGKARAGVIAGGATLGVGLGVLAGGIAYLLLDSEPVDRRCNGINVDADGDCKYLHDTRNLGLGLTVAGGVLAATGVGVLAWGLARKRKAGGDATARLRVSPTGLSLSGRF